MFLNKLESVFNEIIDWYNLAHVTLNKIYIIYIITSARHNLSLAKHSNGGWCVRKHIHKGMMMTSSSSTTTQCYAAVPLAGGAIKFELDPVSIAECYTLSGLVGSFLEYLYAKLSLPHWVHVIIIICLPHLYQVSDGQWCRHNPAWITWCEYVVVIIVTPTRHWNPATSRLNPTVQVSSSLVHCSRNTPRLLLKLTANKAVSINYSTNRASLDRGSYERVKPSSLDDTFQTTHQIIHATVVMFDDVDGDGDCELMTAALRSNQDKNNTMTKPRRIFCSSYPCDIFHRRTKIQIVMIMKIKKNDKRKMFPNAHTLELGVSCVIFYYHDVWFLFYFYGVAYFQKFLFYVLSILQLINFRQVQHTSTHKNLYSTDGRALTPMINGWQYVAWHT